MPFRLKSGDKLGPRCPALKPLCLSLSPSLRHCSHARPSTKPAARGCERALNQTACNTTNSRPIDQLLCRPQKPLVSLVLANSWSVAVRLCTKYNNKDAPIKFDREKDWRIKIAAHDRDSKQCTSKKCNETTTSKLWYVCSFRHRLMNRSISYVRQFVDFSSSPPSSHQVLFLKPFRKKDVTALSCSSSSLKPATARDKKSREKSDHVKRGVRTRKTCTACTRNFP